MKDFLLNPWPWWFSGGLIAVIMFMMLFFGKSFGFSSNLRTICAMTFGRKIKFFDFDWRENTWNLTFLVGAAIGGFISYAFMHGGSPVEISDATVADLAALGFGAPEGMQPNEVFAWESVMTLKGFLVLAVGGFLVGFGTRYAGGCTSGHAISGLSNLQWPSLVAVIGFFIGGLLMTHVLFPLIY
jgi:uncharacterized membrane protein YedE/YeeE